MPNRLPPLLPPFIAPAQFTDAAAAMAQVQTIYHAQIEHLRSAMQRFVANADTGVNPENLQKVRAFYPFVRIHTDTMLRSQLPDLARLSFGFVAEPGRYETTLTRPDLYATYYLEQFRLLLQNHKVVLEIGTSTQPIPIHFSFAEHDFTAPRVDYSLHRLRHYTGTAPEWFQNFVLFTNYQFYIDEFVKLGHEAMENPASDYIAFIEPGNVVTRRVGLAAEAIDALGAQPPRLPQMPGYHLVRADRTGISMVNIGVGPANAKNITDHIAVLRPHAWIMLGHCAGLRNTQQLGDYVLAHGYVREDHVLDEELPLWVPIPALAEIQVALEQAVADVTQMQGAELKLIMRTGTVASTDNRNWELLPNNQPQRRFSQSRAVALDMESATIAANGFRFRVPYGTLLCVSDKPLHGEIKLPGMANHFYRERVDQHLRIGIRAIELLRERGADQLHSRKLRSFAEVAFQ